MIYKRLPSSNKTVTRFSIFKFNNCWKNIRLPAKCDWRNHLKNLKNSSLFSGLKFFISEPKLDTEWRMGSHLIHCIPLRIFTVFLTVLLLCKVISSNWRPLHLPYACTYNRDARLFGYIWVDKKWKQIRFQFLAIKTQIKESRDSFGSLMFAFWVFWDELKRWLSSPHKKNSKLFCLSVAQSTFFQNFNFVACCHQKPSVILPLWLAKSFIF